MKALTARAVLTVKPDPGKRVEIPDAALPGFYLILQPSGAKSWALRYRYGGKPRKLTLGRYPAFGLKEARTEARKALQLLEYGADPGVVKKTAKAEAREIEETGRDKMAAVVDLFIRRHAQRNRRWRDVLAMFRREVLPKWGEKRIQDITKRDAVDLLDAIVDRGSPITANRLRAHLNTLFGWAKRRDIITASPLEGIKPPAPEKPRDRVLTDQEILWFWKACDKLGQPFGSLYQFLLLTGQRLREGAEMTESEVHDDVWIIPAARSKNGDEHTVPLSGAAQGVLASLPRIRGNFRFTTTGTSPVSGFTRAKARLDRQMADIASQQAGQPVEITPFTIHDLRRTAATGIAGLRFPPHVVEAILNHKSGTRRGVAGVYNRFDYADEKRAALEAWAAHVMEIFGEDVGAVVPFKGADR
jgi:integrase